MVGTTVSHYQILEKLGEGGMGVVYKAHDTKLNRDVALKFLPKSLSAHEPERARFLQEAQAAAALNHPHICAIYSIGEEGEQQYIEMEFVEGVTLREKFSEGGKWQVAGDRVGAAVGYAIQIAEALQEAHCHGIVHRDIKADNIMINSKNQVKVMDFGLAKLKGSTHLTKTSSTIGTLAYMAPEQIEGGEVDARSDIFSFGIVLYEMLTGHLPFRGEHEAAVMYSIVNEAPAPLQQYLPDAPSELLHILDRALEKDREDRYQTVQEMLIDLRRLKKDSTRVTRPITASVAGIPLGVQTVSAAEKRSRRRKPTWIAIGAVVALIAIALSVLLQRKSEVRLNPNRTSLVLSIPFKRVGYPSLSPEGKLLVFPAQGEDGTWDVYYMNVAGSTPRRVTEEHSLLIESSNIALDLSLISYNAWVNGISNVKVIPIEGGQGRTVVDTGRGCLWSPDGKRIGYCLFGGAPNPAPSASRHFEIWSIRPDGSDRRREIQDSITTGARVSYSWSPDGKSMAWIRAYPGDYSEIFVREPETGRERQVTHLRNMIDDLFWAANGQIIFVSNRSGQSNLWMIPGSGESDAVQITQGTAPIRSSYVSSDAKRILFLQYESIKQIWTSAINGTSPRPVTLDEVRTDACAFSPDGQFIAAAIGSVDDNRPGQSLYIMDRHGKDRRLIVSSATDLGKPFWAPDGNWLAYRDAGRVYLTSPANPGAPRLLCEGSVIRWMNSEELLVWSMMKSFRYSVQGEMLGQLSKDSLMVYARKESKFILFRDFRRGRTGVWTGTLESLDTEPANARKVVVRDSAATWVISDDLQFALFQKNSSPWGGIWRVSLADGKTERIGAVPAQWISMQGMTRDGNELLWIKDESRAKLSVIEDPFE